MLRGATWSAPAIVGTAVLRIVVSSDSIKNATAMSHGTRRLLEAANGGFKEGAWFTDTTHHSKFAIHGHRAATLATAGSALRECHNSRERREELGNGPAQLVTAIQKRRIPGRNGRVP